MRKYKIIWFDDEYDSLEILKEKAIVNGINHIGFINAEEGILELENNYKIYDAVIIDGLFYNKKGQSGDVKTDKALAEVFRKLDNLKDKKIIPSFILSGQKSFTKDVNPYADLFKGNKVYDKQNERDLEDLWKDIKTAADQLPDTQIRHEYQEVFSIFSLGYLPREIEQQVLELIKSPLPQSRVEIKGILSNIRSIHESCLLKLEEINVIPDSQAQFSNVVKHLSGNKTHPTYQPTTKEYQNTSIENLNKWLYFTCGQYIHNLKDENYKDYMISKYAVESLRNGVLELLLWFNKTYIENK